MSNGWKDIQIGDACLVTDFVSNGSFASLRENVEYNYEKDYGILVRTTDFTKNWAKDFVYVPKTAFDFLKKSELREGDVVISNVGAPGVTFRVPDLGQPMTLGPNAILVRTHDENVIRQDYIYRFFESPVGQDMLKGITSGTTQMKFNKTNFRDLRVPTPPPKEQQRIVGKLDAAFAALAEAQAHVERNRANARELFESYRSEVFERTDWRIQVLGELCDVLDSRRKPITKRDRVAGPYPYYGATGLLDHIDNFIFDEPLVLIGEDGAKWGANENSAYSIEGKTWVNNHAHVIRPRREVILDNWIVHYLNHADLSHFVSGLTVPKLNQGQMREIPIPVPPITEQKEYLKKLDSLLVQTSMLEAAYQQKLTELAGLKKAVLGAAFRGEL